jgi:NAD(P)-dependent dehydrogenase (short-subunit alcohol dehydrogenase family)
MSQNVEGKVVVITGASSGLGEATAKILAAQGATVVLGARRKDRIQALSKELTAGGGKALAVATDVADRQQVKNLVDAAVEAYGRVDVMINNAGLMPHALLERLQVDEWERMIDVNLKGVLYGIAAALPVMKQQKSGHFINVSSVAGHTISRPPVTGHEIGGVIHVLDPACDGDRDVAMSDFQGRVDDRLGARAADPVDRRLRHLEGQATTESCLAGWVHFVSGLDEVPENQRSDLVRRQAGTAQRLAHHRGAQGRRRHVLERAVVGADRRADRAAEHDF